MNQRTLWLLALGMWLAPTATLAAQGGSGKEGYSDEHHRNECRLANQVLTLGQPANRREWALETAPDCGASGGEALAKALEMHRADRGDSDGLEAVVFATSQLTDGNIFRSALRIAEDPSAGTAARVAAWRVVQYQLVPGTYAEPVPLVEGEFQGGVQEVATFAPRSGAPLPADRLVAVRQAVEDGLAATGFPSMLTEVMERVLAAVELEEHIERVCGPGASIVDPSCEQALQQHPPS